MCRTDMSLIRLIICVFNIKYYCYICFDINFALRKSKAKSHLFICWFMKNLITYLFSRKKEIYTEIARKNGCGVLRVCALAHGAKTKTNQDFAVIQDLIARGVVRGYKLA